MITDHSKILEKLFNVSCPHSTLQPSSVITQVVVRGVADSREGVILGNKCQLVKAGERMLRKVSVTWETRLPRPSHPN